MSGGTEYGMLVLLWFAVLVLIISSVIVIFAGLTGREAIMRIGKKAVEEGGEERQTLPRSVRLDKVVLGCIGLSVGLAIVVILSV